MQKKKKKQEKKISRFCVVVVSDLSTDGNTDTLSLHLDPAILDVKGPTNFVCYRWIYVIANAGCNCTWKSKLLLKPSTTIIDLIGGSRLFSVADMALSSHWSGGPSLCDALFEKFAAVFRVWNVPVCKGGVVSPSHQNRNNIVYQGHFLPIPFSFRQDFLKTDHFEWGTNNAHRWMERRTDRRADGPTKRAVESRSTRLKKLHNIAEWTSLCNRCNICSFSSQDMTHINNYGTGR